MVPMKQKRIRGNQSPFINKDIHKAIMARMRLRNRFLKEPTLMYRLAYKRQRNYCVSLMRENKKQYVSPIADNKNFWRVVKPNFSNKILGTNSVMLRDDGKIISDTEKIADTVNKLFVNIGNSFKIDKDKQFLVGTNDVLRASTGQLRNIALNLAFLALKKR